ncbi:MAG TPA: hypothetical protein VFF78_05540, partial [Anaerolineaceae bacterium]|nr:hypothetical protein [Anaerolineaceae bacterium]
VKPIKVIDDILLGHKVAMCDIKAGRHVQEYGRAIGSAESDIRTGQHVHVHNLKSLRWSASGSKVL